MNQMPPARDPLSAVELEQEEEQEQEEQEQEPAWTDLTPLLPPIRSDLARVTF